MQISWNIEGEKSLSRNLRGVSLALKDWRGPLDRAATNLIKVFSDDVFRTRGAAVGVRWAALSPATIARKARTGGSTLVETGAMRDNFQKEVHADHAIIGNETPYFAYHQSNKPRTKIPRRTMMKLGNKQKTMIVREFQKEFQAKLNRSYV
jgi:phage gpG-like protein